MSRAGYMQWGDFTPVWGKFAITACQKFQKAKQLKQTGMYTFPTHEALRKAHRKGSKTEWAFDDYSIKMMTTAEFTPTEKAQMKLLDFMNYTILNNLRIHYLQQRPMGPAPSIPFAGPWYADCSEYATYAYKFAGAPDPSNMGYDGYGNTWSQMAHGEHIDLSQAEVGCLVFYDGPSHVGICRAKKSGVWYVAEHGSERGPLNVPATYRQIVAVRKYSLV